MSAKKGSGSLAERQRKFIFEEPFKFTPVTPGQFRGMKVVRQELDRVIARIKSFYDGADIGGGTILFGEIGTGKTQGVGYILTAIQEYARVVDLRQFPRATVEGREVPLTAEDIHAASNLGEKYVVDRKRPIVFVYDNVITSENSGEDTEFDNILEQLLIELSGLKRRVNGVYIILTSTYNPGQIDAALFRPGRIDVQIAFSELSPAGQREILRYAFEEYRLPNENFAVELDPGADLDSIVELFEQGEGLNTPAAIIDEFRPAVIETARSGHKRKRLIIRREHLINEAIRRITGQLPEETFDKKTQRIMAMHQAGHIEIARVLGLTVKYATILPCFGQSRVGRTSIVLSAGIDNEEGRAKYLMFLLGGKVAEELLGYRGLLGHEDDLVPMFQTIHHWVTRLGGGKKLRKLYGYTIVEPNLHEPSEVVKQVIDRDIGDMELEIEKEAWTLVRQVGMEKMRARIRKTAKALYRKKILLRGEIEALNA